MRPHAVAAVLSSALSTVALLVAGAEPAAAHPFGPPPVARVSVQGDTVDVRYTVAEDDVVALSLQLGAFEERQTFVFEEGEVVEAPPSAGALLAGSPALEGYLLDHLEFRQDGVPCEGRVGDTADLLHAGAQLTFDCPLPVGELEVEASLLTDLHPAYRTALVAEGAEPGRVLATAAEPVHIMDFAAGSGGGGMALPAGAAAAVLGLGGGALAWRRRRRRWRRGAT